MKERLGDCVCVRNIYSERRRERHTTWFFKSKFHNSISICRSFYPFCVTCSSFLLVYVLGWKCLWYPCLSSFYRQHVQWRTIAKFLFRGIQRQICVPRHTDTFVFRGIQRQICVPRHTAPNLCSEAYRQICVPKHTAPNLCSEAYSAKFVFLGIKSQICVPRHTAPNLCSEAYSAKFLFRGIQSQICVPRHTAPNLCS